jgi:hypothetical protein
VIQPDSLHSPQPHELFFRMVGSVNDIAAVRL